MNRANKVQSPLREIFSRGSIEQRTAKHSEYYIKKLKQYYKSGNSLSVEEKLFRDHF